MLLMQQVYINIVIHYYDHWQKSITVNIFLLIKRAQDLSSQV